MRAVKLLSVLLTLLCVLCARPAAAVIFNGHDYTPLTTWASANYFREVNDGRDDLFTLTNRSALRLVFEKNSITATINGVKVALSFPVALDKTGHFFISRFDLAKTVEPLIFSPPLSRKNISTIVEGDRVVVDPGQVSGREGAGETRRVGAFRENGVRGGG